MTTTTATVGTATSATSATSASVRPARIEHRSVVITLALLAAALMVGAVIGAFAGSWWQSRTTAAPTASSEPGAALARTSGLDAEAHQYAGRRADAAVVVIPSTGGSRTADPEMRRYGRTS